MTKWGTADAPERETRLGPREGLGSRGEGAWLLLTQAAPNWGTKLGAKGLSGKADDAAFSIAGICYSELGGFGD